MSTSTVALSRDDLAAAQAALAQVRAFEQFLTGRIREYVTAGLAVDRATGKPVTGYPNPQAVGWSASFRALNLRLDSDALVVDKMGQDEFGPVVVQTFLLPLTFVFAEQ